MRLEDYKKGVNLLEGSSGGRHDGSADSIHWLTLNCTNVEN